MTVQISYRPSRVQLREGIGDALVGRAEFLGPTADAGREAVFEEAPYVQVDGDVLRLTDEPPSEVPGTGEDADADRLVELITGTSLDAGDDVDEVQREKLGPFLGLGDELEPGDILQWEQDEQGAMSLKVWSKERLTYAYGAVRTCRQDLDDGLEAIEWVPPHTLRWLKRTVCSETGEGRREREERLEEETMIEVGPYRIVLWHAPSSSTASSGDRGDLSLSIVHGSLPITPEQLYRSSF